MDSPDTGSESNREQTDSESTETSSSTDQPDSGSGLSLRRRDALLSIFGIGGLGLLGSRRGSAQQGPPPRSWNQDVDAQGNRLLNLGALTMDANGTEIADFEGTGLSIDSGVLNVTVTDTDTHTLVSDSDGSPTDDEADDIEFGTNLDLTGSGGNFTVDSLAEANTGSNLGSGAGVFAGKSGVDLTFRSLTGGSNVSVSSSGDEIQISATDTDTRTNVSDDGNQEVEDVTDIDFTSNLDVSEDGDGSVTVDGSSVSPWADDDGDDLLEAAGFDGIDVDYVETTLIGTDSDRDGSVVRGEVGGQQFLEASRGFSGPAPSIALGDSRHETTGRASTVSGGERNKAKGYISVVGGGENNLANDGHATVGGGIGNKAIDGNCTVAGGASNTADGSGATVGGGGPNTADGDNSTVAGGTGNTSSGQSATVPGGISNIAAGDESFAAGGSAKAADDHAFVWNDTSEYHDIDDDPIDGFSSAETVTSSSEPTGEQTFNVSAQGGVRLVTGSSEVTYISSGSTGWSNTSARSTKTNIDPVDPEAVLDGVTDMEVATWEYVDDDGDGQGVRHIGPMAGEFHEAVDVGDSDDHINSINADGAAFAAIQGLSQQLDEKEARIDELETENEQLRERLRGIEARLADLEAGESSHAAADD